LLCQALLWLLADDRKRQLQAAAAAMLWENHDPRCLPLWVAAGEYRQAARAMVWLWYTTWQTPSVHLPVALDWYQRLPTALLEDDPWYRLLHTCLHMTSTEVCYHPQVLEDVIRRFRSEREIPGLVMAQVRLARVYEFLGHYDAVAEVVGSLRAAYGHPQLPDVLAAEVVLTMVRFYAHARPDPLRLHECLELITRRPLLDAVSAGRHFEAHWHALFVYARWGDVHQALWHWRSLRHLGRHLSSYEFIMQAAPCMAILTGGTAPSWDVDDTDVRHRLVGWDDWMAQFLQYVDGLNAQGAGDYAAMQQHLQAFIADAAFWEGRIPQASYADAVIRLAIAEWRLGRAAAAQELILDQVTIDYLGFQRVDLAIAQAVITASLGETADALVHLDQAIEGARQHGLILAHVVAELWRCRLRQRRPPPELVLVVDLLGYRPHLQRHWPELLPETMAGTGPRIELRTFGGFDVRVDGRPIHWKRSNARLLFLDLLLNPEGSTAEQLEQRYWPGYGSNSLRMDIQALRQALEPGVAPRESSLIVYRDYRYRLMTDRDDVWWDGETFCRLFDWVHACPGAWRQERVRHELSRLVTGPVMADIPDFPLVEAYRERIAQRVSQLGAPPT
jgi:hypothetical protein